jgi:predicted nucleic acid-binding protein
MKVFVDTNILVDLLDARRPGHDVADILFSIQELEFYAAADSFLTIRYIFRKYESGAILAGLLTFYDFINVVDTKAQGVKRAIEHGLKTGNDDIEDVAKLIAAEEAGCELFVTYDQGITSDSIAIISPDEVIRALGWQFNEILQSWEAPDVQQNFYIEQSKKAKK